MQGGGLRRRLGRFRRTYAVPWAHLGSIARAVARHRSATPPVLVISMPRSGSSWVGATLGDADNAAYLREPLTHHWSRRRRQPAVVEIDPASPPDIYQRLADLAFAGIPAFSTDVVRHREQWHPWQSNRRTVIKEVNPFAVRWLLARYQPALVFLVRHPAAVADSTSRTDWIINGYSELFLLQRRASGELREDDVGDDLWRRLGALQAWAMRETAAALQLADDLGCPARLVVYEELCVDPVGGFRELYDFSGLAWDSRIERLVRDRSSGGSTAAVAGELIARDSRSLADRWRETVSADNLAALKHGYLMFDPPFYGPDSW